MKRAFTRRALTALVGAVVVVGMIVPPAVARPRARVDEFKDRKGKLILVKGDQVVRKKLAKNVKVVLRSKSGKKRADVNELVAGAKVLKLADRNRDRKIDRVVLRELPSGSSDCSFDQSEDSSSDEDRNDSSKDESWSCSLEHEGVDEDFSQDCSFDQSEDSYSDPDGGDSSRDTSWDCSYDESSGDDDFSWDCSFDASESASWDDSGGDSDGDTSFDCSWDSSVPLDGPLFECAVSENPLGWTCHSAALDQSFGVTLTGAPVGFDSSFDFSDDYVDLDDDHNSASCSTDEDGSFSCSFDTESENGDCSVDLSFDQSTEGDGTGGDISGDMSYSCSYEIIPGDDNN